MSRWDDSIRDAMRREDPPEGFAERVMARVKAEERARGVTLAERLRHAFRMPQLRWATAVAALALVAGTVEYRGEMERQAEGERARDQVMLALRITGGKLREAQQLVRKVNYAPREQ